MDVRGLQLLEASVSPARPLMARDGWVRDAGVPALWSEGMSAATSTELLDLARLLLTPGARLNKEDDGTPRGMDEWVKARIRWHRLDGNGYLADKLLREENSAREALGKELLDV